MVSRLVHFRLLNLAACGLIIALSSAQAVATDYIMKFKTQQDFDSLVADKQSYDFQVRDTHSEGLLILITLSESQTKTDWETAKTLTDLYKKFSIDYVVPNSTLQIVGAPNDPRYGEQWAHKVVKSEAAWERHVGSHDVVVAVIDTGVALDHPDLAANIWTNSGEIPGNGVDDDQNGFVDDVNGWDFRDNDKDPTDVTGQQNPGHGTHCAGIIGAVGNNGEGVSGISQVVKIMALRTFGADGTGDLMTAAKAIDYAANHGANIISASWGAQVPKSAFAPILESIQRASDKGILFVAAAGNDGADNDKKSYYPANGGLANMMSVAASQSDDGKPEWSNFGLANVDLASPGDKILSTIPGGYQELRGTSMATPLVAGLAALVQAASDEVLTPVQIKAILQRTGHPVNIVTASGRRIDAGAAVQTATDRTLMVVPAAKTVAPDGTQKFEAFGGSAPYQFKVDNEAVGSMAADGTFTSKAVGKTTVTVTDSTGASATSLDVHVAEVSASEGSACPLPAEQQPLCMIMCLISPELPWCSEMPTPPAP